MPADDYTKAESFRLGNVACGWGENFIQNLIDSDPAILGLGDLVVKERERRQVGAGRLDFLLQDSPVKVRYEVEIQLGKTDPSHIIRTIEYWDRERRNAPQLDHVAVIVAEEITSRFFNVISLFNQHIPLIAIKMSGLNVGSKRTVVFTKVLDHTKRISEDEESETQESDRSEWEKRVSTSTMGLVDSVISIAKTVETSIGPKFNRASIVLKVGTQHNRLLAMWPQKKSLKVSLPCSQSDDIESQLESANLDYEGYDERRNRYVLRLIPRDLPLNSVLLKELIAMVYRQAEDMPIENSED